MKKEVVARLVFASFLFLASNLLAGGTNFLGIYSDTESRVTGTWDNQGWLVETNGGYEGVKQYCYHAVSSNNWDRFALNLDNWGLTVFDARATIALRLAFNGPSGSDADYWTVRLLDANGIYGNTVTMPLSVAYKLTNIPVFTLTNGTGISLSVLREIRFDIHTTSFSSTNLFYLDNIFLVRKYTNLDSFKIRHDKMAVVSVYEKIEVEALDINKIPVGDYSGTVTLDTSGTASAISWISDPSNKGSFGDAGIFSDKAYYTFSPLDKGTATFYLSDDLAETNVNIDIFQPSPSIADDNTEGVMNFYDSAAMSGGWLIDDFEDGDNYNFEPITTNFRWMGITWDNYGGSGSSVHVTNTNIAYFGSRSMKCRYNLGANGHNGGSGAYLNDHWDKWNISQYSFIRFWAKGDGHPISMVVATSNISDFDLYHKDIGDSQPNWTEYLLLFDEFAQYGWGESKPFDLTQVRALEFRPSNKVANETGWFFVDNVIVGPQFFEISHDGTADLDTWENIVVKVKTLKGVNTNYSGLATLYVESPYSGVISWTNTSYNNGIFTSLGSGKATYHFVPADKGVVTLKVSGNVPDLVDLGAKAVYDMSDNNADPRWLAIGEVLAITNTSPASAEMNVSIDANIDIYFNKSLSSITITTANLFLYKVSTMEREPVTLSLPQSNLIRIDPVNNLSVGEQYRVYVTTNVYSVDSLNLPRLSYWIFTVESFYYVNDDSLSGDIFCTAVGNDANDGLKPSTPKRNIMSIVSNYTIPPGKIIYVDTGIYPESVSLTNDNGTNGAYVTFQGSTNGTIIDPPAGDAISLKRAKYVSVKNFQCTGADNGIKLYRDASHNQIKDNRCYKNSSSGILIGEVNNTRASSNIIYGNSCYSNSYHGIFLGAPNELALHRNVVTRNSCYDNGYSGIFLQYSDNNYISQNILYGNNTNGMNAALLVLQDADYNLIENNLSFSNKLSGYEFNSCDGTVARNCIAVGNGQYGFVANPAQNVTYSLAWKNVNAPSSQVNGGNFISGEGCLTNNPLFSSNRKDFHLKYQSPCQLSGFTNKAKSTIGRYSFSVSADDKGKDAPSTYSNFFLSTYSGSIPGDGVIYFKFPAGFRFGSLSVSSSSRWGGIKGGFIPTYLGSGIVRIARDGTGTASIAGESENIIITGVTNPSVSSSNYRIRMWTEDAQGNIIDSYEDSNDFMIESEIFSLLSVVKSVSNFSLNGVGIVRPLPGTTVTCKITYSNTTSAATRAPVIFDKVSSNVYFITNGRMAPPGWVMDWSTNRFPIQSYHSPHYGVFPISNVKIRWVRWRNASVPGFDKDFLVYKVVVR